MQNYFDIVRKSPLFSDINEEEFKKYFSESDFNVIKTEKGQIILEEGSAPKYIGLVLTGSLMVVRDDYYGNRSITAYLKPPDMFAEVFVLAGVEKLPVSVAAAEKSEVLMIDRDKVTGACGYNRLTYNLLRIVANKNILLSKKIEVTSKKTTRDKIMAYLTLCAKESGSSIFNIPYNRQELANYLGVERSAMSSEISKLRADGIIECERSTFKLLKSVK